MPAREIIINNIEVLISGKHQVQRLTDEHYSKIFRPWFSASIGQHFRHILDHYLSFIEGLTLNCINYDERQRNLQLESDRAHAIRQTNGIISELRLLLQPKDNHHKLPETVNAVLSTSIKQIKAIAVRSSPERELAFLHSHTTHHYAMIAVIMKQLEIPVDQSFGIAPATFRHQQPLPVTG